MGELENNLAELTLSSNLEMPTLAKTEEKEETERVIKRINTFKETDHNIPIRLDGNIVIKGIFL